LPAIIAGAIYAAWEPSLSESRDIVVVVFGIVGATFFFAALVITTAVGLAAMGLFNKLRSLIDESVAKAYGTFAGIKKGLGVLSGFKDRDKSGK
jgi:hypothetical protein